MAPRTRNPATRRGVLAAAASAALAAPALLFPRGRASAQSATRVSVLHLNDFHARHEGLATGGAPCREGRPCLGGSARLAAAVAAARAEAAREGRVAVLLDAGDQFTGTLFHTVHEGRAEAAVQRALGVQAMALGNHEFDKGPRGLADYAESLPFPVLAANLDAADEPRLRTRIAPWALLDGLGGGVRLAVVGLVTPDTATSSSPGPTLRFGDPAAAAERAVAEIRARHPGSTVVVLSHLGLAADRRLARDVAGVDAVVGGHSHTLLADGLDGAAGPHPVVAAGRDRDARVVQAGAHGRWLGRLDLDLAPDGRVLSHGGAVRELGPDLPDDPAVAALVAAYAAPLEAIRRRRVGGALPVALSNEGCAREECALGTLVAEAMLALANARGARAEVALTNGGGLRAGLAAGEATMGDVLSVLPFSNTLATMTLRGADLLAALENGLSRAPGASGRFPQVAGMRVAWSPAAPPGRRVRAVEVGGAPLDPARAYRVVTNNFLRRGGDGYDAFRDAALEAYDDGPPLEDALVARLADTAAPPPAAEPDGRLRPDPG